MARLAKTADEQHDNAWDNACSRQLRSTLRQSIGEDGLPRSSSKRKLATTDDDNASHVSQSGISHDDSCFEDADVAPVAEATPPKRHRNNDWPLNNNVSVLIENNATLNNAQPSLRSRRGQNLNGSRYPSAIFPGRQSRFQEGSMRDRASVKPPPEFTGENDENFAPEMTDEELNDFGPKISPRKAFYRLQSKTTPHLASPTPTSEPVNTKEPGLVRFGKKFASAFGFHGVLQNVSGIWKGPQDGAKPQPGELSMDRKLRAEKAYADLKASGYPGTNKMAYQAQGARARTASPVKTSRGNGENEFLATNVNKSLPRPPANNGMLTAPTIRSTRSFVSISPSKKQTTDTGPKHLPKQSSVKDLRRMEKLKERLTRKASKLEEEWLKAQRELRALSSEGVFHTNAAAVSTPPSPVIARRHFQPTKLSSLPSERLLLNQDNLMSQQDDHIRNVGTPVKRSTGRTARAVSSTPTLKQLRKSATIIGVGSETDESQTYRGAYKAPPSVTSPTASIARHQPPRESKAAAMRRSTANMKEYAANLSDNYPESDGQLGRSDGGHSLRLRPKQSRAFTATPGQNGVPPLPEKTSKSPKKGDFQWPEDCF